MSAHPARSARSTRAPRVARPASPAVKRQPAPRGPNRPAPTLGERLAALGIASLAEAPHHLPLTSAEASAYLGVPLATLEFWRGRGEGPRFVKVHRSVRYTLGELRAWLGGVR